MPRATRKPARAARKAEGPAALVRIRADKEPWVAPAVAAFYDRLPGLFARSRPRWEGAYDGLMYHAHLPLSRDNVEETITWLDGGKLGELGKAELALLNSTVQGIRWPDVRSLARLEAIEGMTLPRAAALMHVHNPSFASFQPEAVQGLALLGLRVKRAEALDAAGLKAYRRYLEAVSLLREGAPYRAFPETHYFHSWVLEQGLAELAREGTGQPGGLRAPRGPRNPRRGGARA